MKRKFVVLLAVFILVLCHPAAYAAFGPVEQQIMDPLPDPPSGSQVSPVSHDDTAGGNAVESIIQWGNQVINIFGFRNHPAGDVMDEAMMTDECKAVIDLLGCDYELYLYDGNVGALLARFTDLTIQGKAAGFYPLIVIPSDILVEKLNWEFTRGGVENTADGIAAYREKVIDMAQGIDAEAFLLARLDYYMERFEGYDILGEFMPLLSNGRTSLYLDLIGLSQEVIIAKVPAENPWELAAWIPMGGYNACPAPEEQVAVFRYWYKNYGAVPAFVTYDIWQMTVVNPPLTDEAAEALAMEQFAFCEDVVFQGADTIRLLASFLKNASSWFFWWD